MSWYPSAVKDRKVDALHLDASFAFRHPVRVKTTKTEALRLIQRLSAERPERLAELSNETTRKCFAYAPSADAPLDEQFCGNVLLFHCIQWVKEKRPFPVLKPS